MGRVGWFLTGSACLAIIAAAGAGLFILTAGASGFSARTAPSQFETSMARRMRWLAIPRATAQANPVPDTPDVLVQARAHWADHCAVCHANNGSGETEMGKHMYPPAPDMRLGETQRMTDSELFFVIENGIRFTGMPGWGAPGGEHEDSWKLVRFIRHLPQVTPEEERAMEIMNPKGPDDRKEEQQENEFLNGGTIHEPAQHHHH